MGNLTNNILGITDEDLNRYEFPHTHHIMMMLNKTGGFVQEDVNYTNSFETKKEKTDANMKVIKERLQERGTSGTLKHLFYTKFIRTWGDDTFSSSDYASRGTMKNNIITDFVTVPGKYHSYYQAYTETIYIITLVGLVLSFSLKSDNKLICLSKRTILLVALFLTLWECNSRYVIQIMPIIAIVSAYGYSLLINKLYQRKEVKK